MRKDKRKLTDKDLDAYFNMIQDLDWGPNAEEIKENYDPVHIDLTEAQYNVMKERNNWGSDD
ncbi:hypothetical protein CHCC20327_2781 [Bacillus licheniformis]|nr:hypothetical protein CHCC20327_2781 [Bacillus licheniformis]